jgi:hypothetical protein
MSRHIKNATAGAPVSGRLQRLNSPQRPRVIRPQQSPRRDTDSKRPWGGKRGK